MSDPSHTEAQNQFFTPICNGKAREVMDLDYHDFADGGMSIRNSSTRLPYRLYKLTKEFEQKQLYKPQSDTRNPHGTTVKRWEVQGGTCVEMRGIRSWFGQCGCGCWIYSQRDVSTPEFRGRGNKGPRGSWPKYCAGCRGRLDQARADKARREMARLRRDPSSRKRDFEFRERY